MGNRPKPTRLKVLEGNPGKREINIFEPKAKPEIPKMPTWLKAFPVAGKEWKRESEILFKMGILSSAESGILAMRCYLASQVQELALSIQEEGRVIKVTNVNSKGEEVSVLEKTNPKCVQLQSVITEYRHHGSILGLDQVSRTKMKAEPPETKSKAEQFMNRKNGTKK